MKYFVPKSYQLTEDKKWIPNADIFEGIDKNKIGITEEYSLRDQICDTKEEADQLITTHCQEKGMLFFDKRAEWTNEPKYETQWKNEPKHKTEWKNEEKH